MCVTSARLTTKIKRLWFTDFARESHVRKKTKVSSSRFRSWYESRLVRPELMRIVGFDIWRCWPDAMHCLDLGVYQLVAASCLVELVGEGVWHRTDDAGYKAAHVDYKGWCGSHDLPPCPVFSKEKLVSAADQYPAFSQQQAKASMTKYLMLWLRAVLERPGVSAGIHGSVRRSMFVAFLSSKPLAKETIVG